MKADKVNVGGRPPKFTSAEEMQDAITAYFDKCEIDKEPLTISGLAYALDMTTHSLRNYENKDEFFTTVNKAKQLVEMSIERLLISGGAPAGSIFWLKNNAGWKDKTEQEVKTDHTVTILDSDADL